MTARRDPLAEHIAKSFSARLVEIMEAQGLNNRETAEKCRVHEVQVGQWRNGKFTHLMATSVARVAVGLNCSVDYLMGIESKTARHAARMSRGFDYRGARREEIERLGGFLHRGNEPKAGKKV